MRILERTRGRRHDTVMCERCVSGDEATYVVSSDVIHMKVCAACAETAVGLTVTNGGRSRKRPTATSVAREGLRFQMKLGKLLGATTACVAVCVIYSRMFGIAKQ